MIRIRFGVIQVLVMESSRLRVSHVAAMSARWRRSKQQRAAIAVAVMMLEVARYQ